ncbi:hypothetical protein ACM2QH_13260, partial [Enterococcus faecium]
QSINQSKITKNLSQNEVHSDPDLILYNPSVLIDKEPKFLPYRCFGLFFLFLFDHCHCSYPTRTCLLDLDRIATKFEACCWQFV